MRKEKDWYFNKLFSGYFHINELPENALLRKAGENITAYFDIAVDALRTPSEFPNVSINELMTLFWRLVGNNITPSALSESVETVSFFSEIHEDERIAVILVPVNYVTLCKKDPFMQYGALVFTASQARDYYNDRLYVRSDVMQRAYANEAEYLNTIKALIPQFKSNRYQKDVMKRFPYGLASLDPKLNYVSRPYWSSTQEFFITRMLSHFI